ncbi:MAG: DUF6750 family protein [Colwellia sp.]
MLHQENNFSKKLTSNVRKAVSFSTKMLLMSGAVLIAQQATAAGLTDGLNNGKSFGVTLMNVALVLAGCAGAIIALTGMWALNPKSNNNSQTTTGQAFIKIGVGCALISALFFINETSKEFTGQQSSTFNKNVTK